MNLSVKCLFGIMEIRTGRIDRSGGLARVSRDVSVNGVGPVNVSRGVLNRDVGTRGEERS